MVEWLAGNRIRGTSAEKPVLGLQSPSVGGWVELGRTTLGSSGDSISVASLPDKRYYMILGDYLPDGNFNGKYRFNNDSVSNYARRNSGDGATDTTAISQTEFQTDTIAGNNFEQFDIGYVSNLSTKEKLIQMHTIKHDGNGAGTNIKRIESVGKWDNTSDAINRIDCVNASAGSFASGSECVVLGWDPTDTHTTNFWEELASVNGDGTSTTLSSGTITAKKYLWTQMYSDDTTNAVMRFNSDSGSNYARRGSVDGASDFTVAPTTGSSNLPSSNEAFGNCFIINNASNEKLGISHGIDQGTAGADTAPTRKEEVFKWSCEPCQITNISWTKTGNWSSNAILKVWGSD